MDWDIAYMYEVINRKEDTVKDFITFLEFMFENYKYVDSLKEKTERENFMYHFDKIPSYARRVLEKMRHDILGDISSVSMHTNRLSKKVDSFTNIK